MPVSCFPKTVAPKGFTKILKLRDRICFMAKYSTPKAIGYNF